jgi:putative ABC transport system permease protein
MAGPTQKTRFRFWLWLIRAIGVIVPRRLRADWRQEWVAELRYREALLADWDRLDLRHKLDLLWRSTSAFWDALWMQTYRWEDEMIQDLRYGVRVLLKHKGFTLVAVLTLALGIGANTAIFSVINTVLLGSLSYKEADRVVVVWTTSLSKGSEFEMAPTEYLDFHDRNSVFAQMAATQKTTLNLTGNEEALALEGRTATASLFPLLGVTPLVGRSFTPEEDRANALVAVLSYRLWQSQFGGEREIVGREITLNSRDYTVIGVMPEEFQFPPPLAAHQPAEVWVPRSLETDRARTSHDLLAVARIKDGVTMQQAQAEMDGIARQRAQEEPRRYGDSGARLRPIREQIGRELQPSLLVLAGAVGFVLLIACANVANLLLSLAATRQKEIAVRLALGATRLRLVRQLLVESLLLSGLGSGGGLLLAALIGMAIRTLGETQIPRAEEISIDSRVLAFTLLLSVVTGLVFGLAPAWQASRTNLNEALKEGGRSAHGASRHRLRNALIVAEVALSLILLVGAGLLIKSFWLLQQVEPGFDPCNLLSVEIRLPMAKYGAREPSVAFFQQMLEEVKALPGVEAAAIVNHPPFSGRRTNNPFQIEGHPEATNPADQPRADYRTISPDYFQTMSIPILRGRAFNEHDTASAPNVVIISQGCAELYWPGEDPLGRRIKVMGNWLTIVGVVGDVKQSELDSTAAPHTYVPTWQTPHLRMGLLARTAAEPLSFVSAVRRQIQALDRDQPIYNVHTMEELIDESISLRRLSLLLLSAFALIALVLAAVGIYSVMSYLVAQRTHELGVRMALGAESGDVMRLVIGQGMARALTGVAIGLGGAWLLTRILEAMVFGVSTTDPMTFALIAVLLTSVALLACYLPARLATKVDPLVALRHE